MKTLCLDEIKKLINKGYRFKPAGLNQSDNCVFIQHGLDPCKKLPYLLIKPK
jgi:hypothetical protein